MTSVRGSKNSEGSAQQLIAAHIIRQRLLKNGPSSVKLLELEAAAGDDHPDGGERLGMFLQRLAEVLHC